jgi:hypothetical protein
VFEQEPWGEVRADMRVSAQTMWAIAPYSKESLELPDLHYPYFPTEDETLDRIAAIEAAKEKLRNGSLDCKTRDPANH